MTEIYRVVYLSKFDQEAVMSDVIANILTSAKKNNKQRQITGMLLFDYHHFVQILEGPEIEVTRLFSTIKNDVRHFDIQLLEQCSVPERLFGRWEMGFAKLGNTISEKINLSSPSAQAAVSLCVEEASKKAS